VSVFAAQNSVSSAIKVDVSRLQFSHAGNVGTPRP
jgi:hypothetical protein